MPTIISFRSLLGGLIATATLEHIEFNYAENFLAKHLLYQRSRRSVSAVVLCSYLHHVYHLHAIRRSALRFGALIADRAPATQSLVRARCALKNNNKTGSRFAFVITLYHFIPLFVSFSFPRSPPFITAGCQRSVPSLPRVSFQSIYSQRNNGRAQRNPSRSLLEHFV